MLFAARISDYLARSEETANRAMAEYSTHEKCGVCNNAHICGIVMKLSVRADPTTRFDYARLRITGGTAT